MKLIKIINNEDNSFKYFKVNLENKNWNSVSRLINRINLNKEELEPIYTGFSKFWEYLAKEYLDEKFHSEYNQIKHGFRANYGGFSFTVKNKNNKVYNLGGSDFGSSYSVVENCKKTTEEIMLFNLKQHFKNWDISSMLLIIELLSFSINNVRSFALILNNVSGKDVIFEIPDNLEDFDKSILSDIGVTHSTFDVITTELNECKLQDIEDYYVEKIYFKEL